MEDELQIKQGFDRNIDFLTIKEKFLKHIVKLHKNYIKPGTPREKHFIINKLCYMFIALIQLRNGSRISEACDALVEFYNNGDLNEKVVVKIAKSSGNKYNMHTKKLTEHKARYRKIVFPEWIDQDLFEFVMNNKDTITVMESHRLEKRVLDYMLKNFKCNTHSLRYSYINYMLTEKKIPMPTVAKIVGHTGVSQLVTYTQNKECDAVMDMKI